MFKIALDYFGSLQKSLLESRLFVGRTCNKLNTRKVSLIFMKINELHKWTILRIILKIDKTKQQNTTIQPVKQPGF